MTGMSPRVGRHGNPVLLLHGGGQTRHAWGGAARRIADSGHAAFTVDQRGHGDSAWGVDDMAYASDDYARRCCCGMPRNRERGRSAAGAGRGVAWVAFRECWPRIWADRTCLPASFWSISRRTWTPRGVSKIQGFMAERMREGFATLEEAAGAIAAYLPNRPPPRSLEGLAKNLRQGADGRYRWHWDPAFIDGPRTINTGGGTVQQNLIRAARGLTIPVLLVRGQQSELVTEEAVQAFREIGPACGFCRCVGRRPHGGPVTAMTSSMMRCWDFWTGLRAGPESHRPVNTGARFPMKALRPSA